jgi:NADPH:quinone reductase-like Zn-dependent oxidoreductase
VKAIVYHELRPFSAHGTGESLMELTGLIEAGTVTPVIDRVYPLDETASALEHYGRGHTRGQGVRRRDRESTMTTRREVVTR